MDNPNKTAALISCLMVAVWWPVRGWRSFQAALAAFFLLGICLIQTYSRGGLVATGAGLLPVAIGGMWGRAPQKSQILSVGAVVLLLAGSTVLKPDGLGQRLTESGGDPFIFNCLGARVFGRVQQERIQLNEDTFRSGQPYDPANPEALKALPEVRKLIFDGHYKAAENLINAKLRENGFLGGLSAYLLYLGGQRFLDDGDT